MAELLLTAAQPGLPGYLSEAYVVGPLTATTVIALTVAACELHAAKPGKWRWRALAAWFIPAATTAVMLTAIAKVGLDGANEIASILSLFVAVMGNFGQWLVIIRAARKPRGETAPSA